MVESVEITSPPSSRSMSPSAQLPAAVDAVSEYRSLCKKFRVRKPNSGICQLLGGGTDARLPRRSSYRMLARRVATSASASVTPSHAAHDPGIAILLGEPVSAAQPASPSAAPFFSNVTEIDLERNYLGPRGTIAVLELVPQLSDLQRISLRDCCLYACDQRPTALRGDQVLQQMYEVLVNNNTVTSIDLSKNGIATHGYKLLLDLLRRNPVITDVNVDETELAEHQQMHLRTVAASKRQTKQWTQPPKPIAPPQLVRHKKTPAKIRELEYAFDCNPLLNMLPYEERKMLIDCATFGTYTEGDLIIEAGDVSENYFLVGENSWARQQWVDGSFFDYPQHATFGDEELSPDAETAIRRFSVTAISHANSTVGTEAATSTPRSGGKGRRDDDDAVDKEALALQGSMAAPMITFWTIQRDVFRHYLLPRMKKQRSQYKKFLDSIPSLLGIDPVVRVKICEAVRESTMQAGEPIHLTDAFDNREVNPSPLNKYVFLVFRGRVTLKRETTGEELRHFQRGEMFVLKPRADCSTLSTLCLDSPTKVLTIRMEHLHALTPFIYRQVLKQGRSYEQDG